MLKTTSFASACVLTCAAIVSADPAETDYTNPAPHAFVYEAPELAPITTTYSVTTPDAIARDPELDRMAETLDHDLDRIFEYVLNAIEHTPEFGLSKGGYGAYLDGFGTSADQADLMVQLLDASDAATGAGYNARYVYGKLVLTGAEFEAWMGPGSARGACELLAGSGVPASINGDNEPVCSQYSDAPGSLSSVEMRSIWVSADIDGQTYQFDPSYRASEWHRPIASVQAAISGPSNWRNAGAQINSYGGLVRAEGYSPASRDGLRSTLDGFADAMSAAISAAEAGTEGVGIPGMTSVDVHLPLSMAQVVGGRTPILDYYFAEAGARRHTIHPLAPSTGLVLDDLPPSMRTYVRIRLDPSVDVIDAVDTGAIDAAAIYGRRISTDRGMLIKVDGETIAAPTQSQRRPDWLMMAAFFTIDHPYPGDLGDATYQWRISNGLPFYFALSLGERGNGAELRNTQAETESGSATVGFWDPRNSQFIDYPAGGGTLMGSPMPSTTLPAWNGNVKAPYAHPNTVISTNPLQVEVTSVYEANGTNWVETYTALPGESETELVGRADYTSRLLNAMRAHELDLTPGPWEYGMSNEAYADSGMMSNRSYPERRSTKVSTLERYLTQANRILDTYSGLSEGRRVQHHMIGVAFQNVDFHPRGYISGDSLVVEFLGSSSFAGFDSDARDLEAYANASGLALGALERTVMQSISDAPSTNGSATMFDWFANRSDLIEAYSPDAIAEDTNGDLGRNFFNVPYDPGHATPTHVVDTADAEVFGHVRYFGDVYAEAGFDLVVPQSLFLGPARNASRWEDEQDGGFNGDYELATEAADFDGENTWITRGPAFVARRMAIETDGTGQIAIAPAAGSGCRIYVSCYARSWKGSGGAAFPAEIEPPSPDREEIDSAYETWATSFSVDMRTGGLTISPPADITHGAGAFPYSLSFQRTYSSDGSETGPMGWGWSHNFNVGLTTGTNLDLGLGEGRPEAALATIVAAEASLRLFDQTNFAGQGATLRDTVAGQLIAAWWSDALFDNQVSITRGAGSETFIAVPTATGQRFVSESGSAATLTRSGSVTTEAIITRPSTPTGGPPPEYGGGSGSPAEMRVPLDGHPDSLKATVSEAFDRSGLSFTYTSASNVVETYTYQVDYANGDYEPHDRRTWSQSGEPNSRFIGSANRFRPDHSLYPFGVVVDYSYQNGLLTNVVSRIQGSPGVEFASLTFAYEDTGYYEPLEYEYDTPLRPWKRLASVTSGDGRQVSFSYEDVNETCRTASIETVTDLMGAQTDYAYDAVSYGEPAECYTKPLRLRLASVSLPTSGATPFLSFGYDLLDRVSSVENARGATWEYFASRSRARSIDPVGWESRSFYDHDSRLFASISAASRLQLSAFDALGRTIESDLGAVANFPNTRIERRERFYDAYGNTVLERQRPRTNGSGVEFAGDPIEAVTYYGYPAFPNLPTLTVDPLGHESFTCYDPNQTDPSGNDRCGTAILDAPSLCDRVESVSNPDGLPRGRFGPSGEISFTNYDGAGRVTRTCTLVEE